MNREDVLNIVKRVFFVLFFSILGFKSFAQVDTQFWFVVPDVTKSHGNPGGQHALLTFSTFDMPSTITVSMPADSRFVPVVITIPARTSETINLDKYIDPVAALPNLENVYENGVPNTPNKCGLKITATTPITAYYQIDNPLNSEVYSLKGGNALGTKFYVPFQTWRNNGNYAIQPYSSINVVATEDNTLVTVTPSQNAYMHGVAIPKGTSKQVVLQKGEAICIVPALSGGTPSKLAADRLAGTLVTSDKNIAITTNDDSVYGLTGSADTIGDQILNQDALGKTFVVFKTGLLLSEEEDCYVTAYEDNTIVTVKNNDGSIVSATTINAGQQQRVVLAGSYCSIETDKPVSLFHVGGFGKEVGGAMVPSIDRCTGSTQVAFNFLVAANKTFNVNVMVRTAGKNEFYLNGIKVNVEAIAGAAWKPLPGTDWWFLQILDWDRSKSPELIANTSNIFSNKGDLFHFGVFYGGSSNSCNYGYFSDFNQLKLQANVAGVDAGQARVCFGTPIQLYAAGGTTYKWTPSEYLTDALIYNPVANIPTSGTRKYTVEISGACGMTASKAIDVEVFEPIKADFAVDNITGCSPLTVNFKNTSLNAAELNWNFGDGTVSSSSKFTPPLVEELSHVFINNSDTARTFTVQLMVKNSGYCGDVIEKKITVYPSVEAKLNRIDPTPIGYCSPRNVKFENVSPPTALPAADITYIWDYGDGGSVNTSAASVTHDFSVLDKVKQRYDVSLTMINKFGCKSVAKDTIDVYGMVDALFSLDKNSGCPNPEFKAVLTDASTGMIASKNWSWDGFANVASATITNAFDLSTSNRTTSAALEDVRTIKLDVVGAGGCKDSYQQTVTIHPYVNALFTLGDDKLCDGDVLNINNTSSVGATDFIWEYGDGTTSTGTTMSHLYSNSTYNTVQYDVKLTAKSSSGCQSTYTSPGKVTVYSRIDPNFVVNGLGACAPFNATIVNSSKGNAANVYEWNFGDGSVAVVENSLIVNRQHLFTNSTAIPKDYFVDLKVTNEGGCFNSTSHIARVYPQPIADFTVDKAIGCNPLPVNFTATTNEPNYDYSWSFDDGGTASQASILHTYNNFDYTNDVTFNPVLTVSSIYGCSATITKPVTVHPLLKAAFSIQQSSFCAPFDVQITPNSLGATSYTWNFGDGRTATKATSAPFSITYDNTTATTNTYSIGMVATNAGGSCQATASSVPVVVDPKVVANGSFVVDDKCTGAVTFSNTSTGSTSYTWDFGDGQSASVTTTASQKHTYENRTALTKTYTATLTAENAKGCKSIKTFTIDIVPRVESAFTYSVVDKCTPMKINLVNSSLNGTEFQWDYGHTIGGIAQQEVRSSNAPFEKIVESEDLSLVKTYKITLTTVDKGSGCSAVSTKDLTIYPKIIAAYTNTVVDKCNGQLSFQNTTTGATSYTWSFGDQSSSYSTDKLDPISHVYLNRSSNSTIFNVKMVASNAIGCTAEVAQNISIVPRIESSFTYDVVDKCTPMKIKVANSSLNGNEFQWNYGHSIGGIAQQEVLTSNAPFEKVIDSENLNQVQTYKITLTTVDKGSGCSSVSTKDLTIYPRIIPVFNNTVVDKCSGQLSFQNNTTGGVSYTWSFGDQSSSYSTDKLDPISHVFLNRSANSTNFNVKMVASNAIGCTAEASQIISIVPRIESSFTYEVVEKCTPMKINLVNSSLNGSDFQWDYGHTINGVAQQEIRSSKASFDRIVESENLNSVQTYTLKLTTVDKVTGCSAVSTKDLTIYPKIIPAYTNAIVDKCLGQVSFQNTTTGAANYTWFFGDQSSSYTTDKLDAISHVFLNRNSNSTTFNAKLVASNAIGCSSEMAQDITIVPRVESSFTLEELDICTPVKVKLTNSSLNGQQFTWDYGHTIGGVPQMEVKTDKLVFEKILDSESANSVQTYPIKLSVLDKNTLCADDSTIMLAVHPRLMPSFASDKMTGCSNLPVVLTNSSTGGTMLFGWDFNDGQSGKTSTVSESVAHTFVNRTSVMKNYNVMLTATNTKGCKATVAKIIGVYPKVEAAFTFVQPSKCTPFPIDINNSSLNGTEYSWDFGHTANGNRRDTVTTTKSGFRTYIYNGNSSNTQTYTFTLTARDAVTGCSDMVTKSLDAQPEVKSLFGLSIDKGCNPLAVSFTNNSTGSSTYSWNFGNNTSGSSLTPAPMVFSNSDTVNVKFYNISLTAKNADGCTNVSSKRVDVYPKIMADFNLDKVNGCTPLSIKVNNAYPSSAYRYEWTLGSNGANTDQQIPNLNFINSTADYSIQNEKIKLKVFFKGDASCYKEVERSVDVYPSTRSDFSMDVTEACNPLVVNFANKTKSYNNSTSYRWSFDNLGSSGEINPRYTFNNLSHTQSASYAVKLKSSSIHGCNDSITRSVVVRPNPQALMAINTASGCAPFNVEVQNLSVGVMPNYTFWLDNDKTNSIVRNGNSSVQFNIDNLASTLKTTEVWMKAVSDFGCKDSISQKVFTYPHVTSSFTYTPSDAGCNPLTVNFANSSKNTTYYTWDFDDGVTAHVDSPNHVFQNYDQQDKTFNVKLKVKSEYGCEHISSKDFTVYSAPIAYFTIDPPLRTYPDASFLFNNQTSPKATNWNYEWTFGDGNKYVGVDPPVYTYKTWGDQNDSYKYHVTLKVSNGNCKDEMTQFLYLKPAIPVSIFASSIGSSCAPLESQFTQQAKYYKSIEWTFGDGTSSTEENPFHVYKNPGKYHVQLAVKGDGGTTYSYKTLEVFPNPVASFKAAPAEAMLPEAKVQFYNTSLEGAQFRWDFGDYSGSSTEKNPAYAYKKLGGYDVKLHVTSENGCVDDTLVKAAVKVVGEGLLKFPNAFIPNSFGGSGGAYELPDYKNEVFHPISEGVVVYKLLVYNRWGEKLFDSNDIKIGWDGYYRGKLCEQGVYVYRATGRYTNGKTFDIRGDVTLLR